MVEPRSYECQSRCPTTRSPVPFPLQDERIKGVTESNLLLEESEDEVGALLADTIENSLRTVLNTMTGKVGGPSGGASGGQSGSTSAQPGANSAPVRKKSSQGSLPPKPLPKPPAKPPRPSTQSETEDFEQVRVQIIIDKKSIIEEQSIQKTCREE